MKILRLNPQNSEITGIVIKPPRRRIWGLKYNVRRFLTKYYASYNNSVYFKTKEDFERDIFKYASDIFIKNGLVYNLGWLHIDTGGETKFVLPIESFQGALDYLKVIEEKVDLSGMFYMDKTDIIPIREFIYNARPDFLNFE